MRNKGVNFLKTKGIFYAVGIGSGTPEDMTLYAKQVLENADVILIPIKKEGEASTAFKIAEKAADMSRSEHIEMIFPMKEISDYRNYLSEEKLFILKSRLDSGKNIAMITLGDSSVYSTAAYVRQILENDGYTVKTVSGIPSFISSASKAGISLCENRESMVILSGMSDENKFEDILKNKNFENIIIMKAGKALPLIIPVLEKNNLLKNTLMLCNVGMENEYIGEIQINKPVGYFTTLIIKKGGLKKQ